ncbi:hypothetical protein SAMN04488490_3200 [Marinobacter sp. LV10R510-11A]|uniref:hypothetical protein n=1 Tax=Marinobacter sp. LV10R510-11A TaxID=1415568 RepID=UPI000BB983D2|nr:hypothetical protein [Marinobacter sp. LV10R510-11A]SOB77395.1 hypothetical protein SAMN04488490_3200 [Marinobacter sp. LV10R510-11A]
MQKRVIDSQYQELLENLADLNQMKQVVNHAFKREFEVLEQYSNSQESAEIVSREAFGFDNPFTGKLEKYAFRTATIEDLKLLTYWHKNSQYCWLLMSAYEKFEKFLALSYFEATGKRSRTLNPMLLYFSDSFSSIKAGEAKNAFDINLRVAVHLVEKMRHAIAHDQCLVPDATEFTSKVIRQSGIGNDRRLHEEFVSQFIFENKVFILEVPANNHTILKTFHDQYRILVSYLISYAYLVKDAASQSGV